MTAKVISMPGSEPAAENSDDYAAAREACRVHMHSHGLSIAAAARELGRGCSQATLSQWLAGRYTGDVGAVTARVRRWLDTRASLAAHEVSGAGLDRCVQTGATEKVHYALRYAQAEADIACVTGPSGAGKSTALCMYTDSYWGATRVAMTVAVRTPAGMLSRVAAAVGVGDEHRSALAAETAIIEQIRDRGALLIVDEAHHLSPALIDELRGVRDIARCGLALVGDGNLSRVLSSRGCAQIVGRIGARVGLTGPSDADVLAIAVAVVGRAPGKRAADIALRAAREPGGLHAVRRLLARAFGVARGKGRDMISDSDLCEAAFEDAG